MTAWQFGKRMGWVQSRYCSSSVPAVDSGFVLLCVLGFGRRISASQTARWSRRYPRNNDQIVSNLGKQEDSSSLKWNNSAGSPYVLNASVLFPISVRAPGTSARSLYQPERFLMNTALQLHVQCPTVSLVHQEHLRLEQADFPA